LDYVVTFRGQTVAGGKMKGSGHNANGLAPIRMWIIVVVLQVFREGIVTTMDHYLNYIGSYMVSGGVLRRSVDPTPGSASVLQ
jgi:hypothetical protein